MDLSRYERVWFTSDLHFEHANIMKWCPKTRPWKSVDEMNEGVIETFNQYVGPKDFTFILGDVSFTNLEKTLGYMRRLNGDQGLVIGNHDAKLIKHPQFRDLFEFCRDLMSLTLLVPTEDGPVKQRFVLCHYPILEFDQQHRGAMHVHGHLHGKPSGHPGRAIDVGWDVYGKPVSLEQVYKEMLSLPIIAH
jgi:calcineurin-like phosphoesterase family protein